jgi:hypothetical protein
MKKWYLIGIVFAVLALVTFGLDFYTHYSDWYFYFLYNGVTDVGIYFAVAIFLFAVLAIVSFVKGYFSKPKSGPLPQT